MLQHQDQFLEALHKPVPLKQTPPRQPSRILVASDQDDLARSSFKSFIHEEFKQWTLPLGSKIASIPPFDREFCTEISPVLAASANQKRLLAVLCGLVAARIAPAHDSYAQHLLATLPLSEGEEFRTFVNALDERLRVLRPSVIPQGATPFERAMNGLNKSLSFGVKNVAHFSFSLFLVIPSVFHEQHGRLPSFDEYRNISHSALQFLQKTSLSELRIFDFAASLLRRQHILLEAPKGIWLDYTDAMGGSFPLHAVDFTLVGDELRLTESCMEDLRRLSSAAFEHGLIPLSDYRLGCPAAHLFAPIFRLSQSLAVNTICTMPQRGMDMVPHF